MTTVEVIKRTETDQKRIEGEIDALQSKFGAIVIKSDADFV